MDANAIPSLQNEEAAIRLLQARQWTYLVASRLMVLQIVLTVLLPVAGTALTLFYSNFRPHFAAIALVVLLLDTVILDRQYKLFIKRAAKLSEKFDCMVLQLPWNSFVVGEEPEAEDIRAASRAYSDNCKATKLYDWYPVAVGDMPIALGRIVCQRTNLRYDSEIRRSFGTIIIVTVTVVTCALFVAGLVQDLNLTAWILTLTPATPLLSWAGREYFRQRDTAEMLEDLMKKARALWNRALSENCEAAYLEESRELQNAIYLRRSTSPLVIPYLYKIKRLTLEDEMNDAASDFLAAYRKRKGLV